MSINSLQDFRNTRTAIIDPAEPGAVIFQYVERNSQWFIILDATTGMFHLLRDNREESVDISLDELERQLYTTWTLECNQDLYHKEAEQAGDLMWTYALVERGLILLAQQALDTGTQSGADAALNYLDAAAAIRELHDDDSNLTAAEALIVRATEVLSAS